MKKILTILIIAASTVIADEDVALVEVRKAKRVPSKYETQLRHSLYSANKELAGAQGAIGRAQKQRDEAVKAQKSAEAKLTELDKKIEALGQWGVKWQSRANDLDGRLREERKRRWSLVAMFGGVLCVIGFLFGIMMPKGNGRSTQVFNVPPLAKNHEPLPEIIENKSDDASALATLAATEEPPPKRKRSAKPKKPRK